MVNNLHGPFTEAYVLAVTEYDGDPDKANSFVCHTPHEETLGFSSGDGSARYPAYFTPYFVVHLPGDTVDTTYCEDCFGWLAEAAPHIIAANLTHLT